MDFIGNTELLKCHKTAFFAPGKISVASVMPSYDWATEMARKGECVISGFTRQIQGNSYEIPPTARCRAAAYHLPRLRLTPMPGIRRSPKRIRRLNRQHPRFRLNQPRKFSLSYLHKV